MTIFCRYVLKCEKGVFGVFADEEHCQNGQKINYEVRYLYRIKN
jgi:hypothetical protein